MSIPDNLRINNIDIHDTDNNGTSANDFTNSVVNGD